jgi:hypothetical protein
VSTTIRSASSRDGYRSHRSNPNAQQSSRHSRQQCAALGWGSIEFDFGHPWREKRRDGVLSLEMTIWTALSGRSYSIQSFNLELKLLSRWGKFQRDHTQNETRICRSTPIVLLDYLGGNPFSSGDRDRRCLKAGYSLVTSRSLCVDPD